jgi:hypothetical protein
MGREGIAVYPRDMTPGLGVSDVQIGHQRIR